MIHVWEKVKWKRMHPEKSVSIHAIHISWLINDVFEHWYFQTEKVGHHASLHQYRYSYLRLGHVKACYRWSPFRLFFFVENTVHVDNVYFYSPWLWRRRKCSSKYFPSSGYFKRPSWLLSLSKKSFSLTDHWAPLAVSTVIQTYFSDDGSC